MIIGCREQEKADGQVNLMGRDVAAGRMIRVDPMDRRIPLGGELG
jgi:hypothetical protein